MRLKIGWVMTMNDFITWCESLTMEQMFILTGISILLIGTGLAFLGEWIFRKENERNDEDG
jgi:hypothetical protein